MANILVVTGSVRPNSTNSKVVPIVVKLLEAKGAQATVADLSALQLPFFDAPLPPSSPNFAPDNESVLAWTQLVADADGVVFVTPEYNHTMTPVQINAVDWIGKEWSGKPVALVGYGWTSGGAKAHETAHEALGVNLKADMIETRANLFFTKDLNSDGSVADEAAVDEKISAVVDDLLNRVQ